MNESDLHHTGGGTGGTENAWGKDPKFSWWEKLVIAGVIFLVAIFIVTLVW